MQWARAVLGECFAVFGRAIPLMLRQTVRWMDDVEGAKQGIAVHFGDYGGGSDGKTQGIAVEELGLWAGMIDQHGIEDDVVGGEAEAIDGAEHG